jgi:hypothetical protein
MTAYNLRPDGGMDAPEPQPITATERAERDMLKLGVSLTYPEIRALADQDEARERMARWEQYEQEAYEDELERYRALAIVPAYAGH